MRPEQFEIEPFLKLALRHSSSTAWNFGHESSRSVLLLPKTSPACAFPWLLLQTAQGGKCEHEQRHWFFSWVMNLILALKKKKHSLLNFMTKVREAVLGRGDSGSLVADIVLPTSREVARIERVSFYLWKSICLLETWTTGPGETDLEWARLLRGSWGAAASLGCSAQEGTAGLCSLIDVSQEGRKPEHKKPKLTNNNIHGACLCSVILVIQFLEGTTISMPYGIFRIF